MNIDIYCTVIDNYGDAGVSLRLARELKRLGAKVRLCCDDLTVLRTIALPEDEDAALRFLPFDAPREVLASPSASVVVAAFACHLPTTAVQLINAHHSIVLYLDYLSAEEWVEDFHGLSAPAEFARGFYFYPGFTAKTGGLLLEPQLKQQAKAALALPYFASGSRQVTLFSYHNPQVLSLLKLLETSAIPTTFTVFAGKPLANINTLLGLHLQVGESYQSGKLCFKAQGMVSQAQYDDFLCRADLNLVRGEDSIVRALCVGKPCLWQIYPQSDDIHIGKLQALLTCFKRALGENYVPALTRLEHLMLAYNGHGSWELTNFDAWEQTWQKIAQAMQNYIFSLPNLAESMLFFCQQKQEK